MATAPNRYHKLYYCHRCDIYFGTNAATSTCCICFFDYIEEVVDEEDVSTDSSDNEDDSHLDIFRSRAQQDSLLETHRVQRTNEDFLRQNMLINELDTLSITNVADTSIQLFCHMCEVQFEGSINSKRCPLCSNDFVQEISDLLNDELNYVELPNSSVELSQELNRTNSQGNVNRVGTRSSLELEQSHFPERNLFDYLDLSDSTVIGATTQVNRRLPVVCYECGHLSETHSANPTCDQCSSEFVEEVSNPEFDIIAALNDDNTDEISSITPAVVERPSRNTNRTGTRRRVPNRTNVVQNLQPRRTPTSIRAPRREITEQIRTPSSQNSLLTIMDISQEQIEANGRCSVCWEDFTTRENIAELPCKHIYHEPCILPWLETHNTCPVCRRNYGHRRQHPERALLMPGNIRQFFYHHQ